MSPSSGVSAEEVQVSYDPGTNRSTVDDRWRAPDGDLLGGVTVHREPFGQAGAEATARFFAAVGHPVRFDVAGDLVDLEQRGR
jgi:hypothetical protein